MLSYYRPKIQNIFGFKGRKMKCWGSSETRFDQVPGQSEPSSGGKRTFKVRKKIAKNRRNMKCRGSSETRFGKVSRRSEPSLRSKAVTNYQLIRNAINAETVIEGDYSK